MPLVIPTHITQARVSDETIMHNWDDDDPGKAYLKPDERVRKKISAISFKGVIALSLGFSEWIAWRQAHQNEHLLFLQQIEATWTGIVDWRYMVARPDRPDLQSKEWQGPIRGPLYTASELIRDIVHLIKTRQFAFPEAVCLSQLAIHVMPNPQPFREWRRFAVLRLAETDPIQQDDILGKPIPREALEPAREYGAEQASGLLTRFIHNLNYVENPYLASPECMKNAGFEGTPYHYDNMQSQLTKRG